MLNSSGSANVQSKLSPKAERKLFFSLNELAAVQENLPKKALVIMKFLDESDQSDLNDLEKDLLKEARGYFQYISGCAGIFSRIVSSEKSFWEIFKQLEAAVTDKSSEFNFPRIISSCVFIALNYLKLRYIFEKVSADIRLCVDIGSFHKHPCDLKVLSSRYLEILKSCCIQNSSVENLHKIFQSNVKTLNSFLGLLENATDKPRFEHPDYPIKPIDFLEFFAGLDMMNITALNLVSKNLCDLSDEKWDEFCQGFERSSVIELNVEDNKLSEERVYQLEVIVEKKRSVMDRPSNACLMASTKDPLTRLCECLSAANITLEKFGCNELYIVCSKQKNKVFVNNSGFTAYLNIRRDNFSQFNAEDWEIIYSALVYLKPAKLNLKRNKLFCLTDPTENRWQNFWQNLFCTVKEAQIKILDLSENNFSELAYHQQKIFLRGLKIDDIELILDNDDCNKVTTKVLKGRKSFFFSPSSQSREPEPINQHMTELENAINKYFSLDLDCFVVSIILEKGKMQIMFNSQKTAEYFRQICRYKCAFNLNLPENGGITFDNLEEIRVFIEKVCGVVLNEYHLECFGLNEESVGNKLVTIR